MSLDIDFVRSQFPSLQQPALTDQAFFENAGGAFPCRQVIDRLTHFYTDHRVQPYGPFAASRLAGEEMDEARARLAAMLNVETDELTFGPSTSANTYVLAQAFGQSMRAGEAIVVTDQDHEANTGPWRRLADAGIEVREWRMDPETGHLDPADLDRLLDGDVRLVCFPHVSNVVAEINDVAAICERVHAAGAVACVDGVSYAPHGLPDVGTLGADIYLFSAYKVYGPHQGLMTIRRSLGERLPNQAHWFNGETLYKRFTPAGPDHAQVAACAGIADYIDGMHRHHGGGSAAPHERSRHVHDTMRAHETDLLAPLMAYLSGRQGLRVLGPARAEDRAPTVAIALGTPGREIAASLARHGIMAGGGHFYAARALSALGIDPDHGVLRLSFVHYTSRGDLDRLMRALDRHL